MPEFTFSLQTPEGTDVEDDQLGRFHDAMIANPHALGPAALVDELHHVLSCRFQVEAPTLEEAEVTAIRAFTSGLEEAGLPLLFKIDEAVAGDGAPT